MNAEFTIKEIIRSGGSAEKRAEKIVAFTTYEKDDVVKVLKEGGATPSDIYRNLINLWRLKNER